MREILSHNLGIEKEVRVNISGNNSPRIDLSNVNQEITPSKSVKKKRTSKRIGEIMNIARRRESMEQEEESSDNPNLFESSLSNMDKQENHPKSERPLDTFMDLLDKEHKKIDKKKITPKPKVMSKSSRSLGLEQYSSESSDSSDQANEDGDKIFREKLRSLNFQNCNQIAAQYFRLAYRGVRILHFHNGTFAQKSYFMATSPFVRELKMYMCWLYMFLTFFEPDNSQDTKIHRQSLQFR